MSIHSYVCPRISRKALEEARENPPKKVKFVSTMIAVIVGALGTLCENVRASSDRKYIGVGDGILPTALLPIKLYTPAEFSAVVLKQNAPTKVFHRSKKTSLTGMLFGDTKKAYTALVMRQSNGSFTFKEVKTTADGHNQKELVSIEGTSDAEKKAIVSEFKTGRVLKKTLKLKKARA
jgi:hypothetical protein